MLSNILIACGTSLVAGWMIVPVMLLAFGGKGRWAPESVRIFPDSLRLAASMYRDRTLPTSVRWRLRIAVVYPIQPINLIPNFIPLIGQIDTVLVMAWALRSSIRVVGPKAIRGHWKGSEDSLSDLYTVLRLPTLTTRTAARPCFSPNSR